MSHLADRTGAASATVVQAVGVPVEITVTGDRAPEVVTRLARLWELCPATPGASPRATVEVVFDSRPDVVQQAHAAGLVARVELEDLLQVVTQRVTVAAIDARAGECFMLHAACVADPVTAAAVAFVAPGGTGKTTLVRTLGPGRWYVTDETTVVLDDRTVVPYPKPLSIRRSPSSLHKDETAPMGLGLRAPTAPVHLAGLCLLERDDQHEGDPVVTPMGTLDAVVGLVPHSSHLPRMIRPLQRLAALCEAVGGVHRVTYRDAATVAGVLEELLAGTPTRPAA